jgi:hypothetical protein
MLDIQVCYPPSIGIADAKSQPPSLIDSQAIAIGLAGFWQDRSIQFFGQSDNIFLRLCAVEDGQGSWHALS